MIQVTRVSKHYLRGKEVVRAVDGLELRVPSGKLALLRGPSGCGKTTLIHLCAGLTSPTCGEIIVAGERVSNAPQHERARLRATALAVVFQMFHLAPYLSALENILLPTLTRPIPDAESKALALMAELRIDHRKTHRPDEMSVGERQRCALARALLGEPAVILADEPTGNLDEESAALVLDKLAACRQAGATTLLVSHQPLTHITPDLIFSMRQGRLETTGAP